MKVVLIYALFAALWILGSDGMLGLFVTDVRLMAQIGMFKGWAFVAVTSVLLYGLMRRLLGRPMAGAPVGRAESDTRAIGLCCTDRDGADRCRAVGQLPTAARPGGFAHRGGRGAAGPISSNNGCASAGAHAQLIRTSSVLADMYRRVFEAGEAATEPALRQRLNDFGQAIGSSQVFIVDATSRALLRDGRALEPAVASAAGRALSSGEVQLEVTRLGSANDAPTAIDIVVPLLKSGTPPRAAVVMRLDPKEYLLPTLAQWPVPSTSGADAAGAGRRQPAGRPCAGATRGRWHRPS